MPIQGIGGGSLGVVHLIRVPGAVRVRCSRAPRGTRGDHLAVWHVVQGTIGKPVS